MPTTTNTRIPSLFMWLIAIGVAHMSEQLLTNIEEFYMIRGLVDDWHAMFPADKNGQASVILITLVFTTVSLMLWAVAKGGKPALFIMGFLGFFGVTEIHHVFEALASGHYDPGVISSVFYVWFGGLMCLEVWREWRWGPALRPVAA